MKLRDVILNLDKSYSNQEWYGYIDDSMIASLGLGCMGVYQVEDNLRLTCYWVSKWLCTDTHCGIRAFFLDDEFIGIVTQRSRRDDQVFEYISTAVKAKLRAYIMELTDYGEHDEEETMLNLDREMGDGFTVAWAGELIDSVVLVDGKHAKVMNNPRGTSKCITVSTAIGEQLVKVNDIQIPYHMCNVLTDTIFPTQIIEYYESLGWNPFDIDSITTVNGLYGAALSVFMESERGNIVIKTKYNLIAYASLEWNNAIGYYFKTQKGSNISLSDVIGYIVEY